MLVYLTGRKTGRHYRQPISYVRDGETLLTPGGGRWKLNLVEGQDTHVRIRGRDISLRLELVREPVEAREPRAAGHAITSPSRTGRRGTKQWSPAPRPISVDWLRSGYV